MVWVLGLRKARVQGRALVLSPGTGVHGRDGLWSIPPSLASSSFLPSWAGFPEGWEESVVVPASPPFPPCPLPGGSCWWLLGPGFMGGQGDPPVCTPAAKWNPASLSRLACFPGWGPGRGFLVFPHVRGWAGASDIVLTISTSLIRRSAEREVLYLHKKQKGI